ncbi:NUDIX domain-containing protein [Oscillochloris sp. ZM17-4]|uniref:NUDIX domain-containing protein n=1 Tax=Oscillochloris sp. ZM17-4 TaxID=2866714 RepID=UPI001C72CD5E|nr:NUDIX domain-containing protein [Oscillochloris sp. ZM17-4]MBX0326483.1 NUDIX domain-containing protein [Oscillochloris sp. ZM17-4]
MNDVTNGMREGGLTLAYHTIVTVRDGLRRLARPTELGVRSVVTRGDRLLMVRHRSGPTPWSLPGGGVSRGEDLATAALREVREEGGCDAQIQRLLGVYYQHDYGFNNHVGVFVCAALGEARPPVGDIEIVDARFFLPQDVPDNTEAGSLRRIAEFRQGLVGLARSW